jgi:hypothetical protein
MLRYDSGSDLGKGSDTISGKNLGKHPGKELPDRVKTWVWAR